MSSRRQITRREFINGIAVQGAGLSAAAALPSQLLATPASQNYPPALTGLRGSHTGAFEVAHSVAWQGKQWPRPSQQIDADYDLIVVGAGISGLTAALRFQQQRGGQTRILLLDNHDDFGGHAKRNEFTVDGRKLIGYGGSQSIEAPSKYSRGARKVLQDIGIRTDDFYQYFDQEFFERNHLKRGLFFNQKNYGVNRLTDNPFSWEGYDPKSIDTLVKNFPISDTAQHALLKLFTETDQITPTDWSKTKKIDVMRRTSFTDFLQKYAQLPRDAIDVFQNSLQGLWGLGWESLSTLEAIRMGMPGTDRLGLEIEDFDSSSDDESEEPYIFHFPDGNAGVARALLKTLIPSAVAGENMVDWTLNPVDYSQLDRSDSHVRLRLNSTAVRVEHSRDHASVTVDYVHQHQTFRARGKHVIMACYNNLLPHICPEMKPAQQQALDYAEKVPLVYANIAIRNWKAFRELGYRHIHIPKADGFHSIELDFPVSMGRYQYPKSPTEPMVLHASMAPSKPYQGLNSREQHKAGRLHLYGLSFEDFENDLFTQLDGALTPGGFDVERDIAAITVNRWPHGYAYEYNELFDPVDWTPEKGPHIEGRQAMGRISIANSDAAAYAYVDGAMDAALRAVDEQLAIDN